MERAVSHCLKRRAPDRTGENFGRGELTIEKFKLAPGKDGCPKIGWMAFSVRLDGGY